MGTDHKALNPKKVEYLLTPDGLTQKTKKSYNYIFKTIDLVKFVRAEIAKIVSEGNVKIVRPDNVTFAQRATYYGADARVVLEGRPRLIYFPSDDSSLSLP